MTKHVLRCRDNAITSLNASKHGGRLQISRSDYLWRIWRRIGVWGPFSETNFTFCWCRLYSHLCIYVSMYQCIYIATHLHRIYLDWLQAVLVSISRCAWKWQSSASEIHYEAVIEQVCRCTWMPWSCELGGPNRASLEIHLEAVIKWV